MKYNAPKDESGNLYYVPVVAKNKDYLVGYINGIKAFKTTLSDALTSLNMDIDLGPYDIVLDSGRFNDVLENGKRESEMSDDEFITYVTSLVNEISAKIDSGEVENNVTYDTVLAVECVCGLGYYSWDSTDDIPEERFVCSNCGKVVIDYTNKDDSEFEFDGGRKHDTKKD